MSHQVLARKWRPRSFQTLIGQDHVVRALDHALTHDRLHHAYLFTGTRGVGKTTIARILAKAVNCERGVSATPCGECGACREIDEGRFVDYLELDAASNRGVDEMAQLLDNAVYAPTAGRYKVYVIDEVHMLTTFAFNAMLKTLEEPPPHVLFILATTDPQKVPVTVLSRCMQFNLRNMRPQAIAGHLATVLDAESIDFDEGALALLGRSAAGSMRDALSLLDQAIAFGGGTVRQEQVAEMLGTVDSDHVERIFRALADGDHAALVAVADEVTDRNAAADSLLAELAQAVTRMSMEMLAAPPTADAELPAFSPEALQVYYQVLIHGRRDLPLAPDLRAGLMMTLLRMATFAPRDEQPAGSSPGSARNVAPVAARREPASAAARGAVVSGKPASVAAVHTDAGLPAAGAPVVSTSAAPSPGSSSPVAAARALLAARRTGEPKPRAETAIRPAVASVARPAPMPAPMPAAQAPLAPTPLRPARSAQPSAVRADPVVVEQARQASAPASPDPAAPAPDAAPASPTAAFDGDWPALASRLQLPGRPGQFMRQSQLLNAEDGTFSVRVPIATLADAAVLERVRDTLSAYFGRTVRLDAVVGAIDGPTTVQRERELEAARLAQAERTIADDPFIKTLLDEFDAQILPGTVRAIDSTLDKGDNHA